MLLDLFGKNLNSISDEKLLLYRILARGIITAIFSEDIRSDVRAKQLHELSNALFGNNEIHLDEKTLIERLKQWKREKKV